MSADGCRVKVRLSLQALDAILDHPPAALTPHELELIVGKRAQQFKLDVDTLLDAVCKP